MKKACLVIAAALVVPVSTYAQSAAKPCEELKIEIAKKLDAKDVKSYTLEVVPMDKDVQEKVVGTCDGHTKKIVYSRADMTAQKPAQQNQGSENQTPQAGK